MPIYEYACTKCGHEFEAEQRITDAPLKSCPACRGRKVQRLISRTSFVLKGSGWYSDLYSSQSSGSNESDAKGDEASAETKSAESKSESAKSDSKKSKKKSKKKNGSKAAA